MNQFINKNDDDKPSLILNVFCMFAPAVAGASLFDFLSYVSLICGIIVWIKAQRQREKQIGRSLLIGSIIGVIVSIIININFPSH